MIGHMTFQKRNLVFSPFSALKNSFLEINEVKIQKIRKSTSIHFKNTCCGQTWSSSDRNVDLKATRNNMSLPEGKLVCSTNGKHQTDFSVPSNPNIPTYHYTQLTTYLLTTHKINTLTLYVPLTNVLLPTVWQ